MMFSDTPLGQSGGPEFAPDGRPLTGRVLRPDEHAGKTWNAAAGPGHPSKRVRRSRQLTLLLEGPRGLSARTALRLRYVTYLFGIVLGCLICNAGLASVPNAATGAYWLLGAITVQLLTGVAGTMAYANRRPEIVAQVRHYVFGLTLFPAVGLTGFMLVVRPLTSSATTTNDTFLAALSSALPFMFFLPILVPTVVFIKTVAGFKTLNRVTADDEELMATLTRQDTLMR